MGNKKISKPYDCSYIAHENHCDYCNDLSVRRKEKKFFLRNFLAVEVREKSAKVLLKETQSFFIFSFRGSRELPTTILHLNYFLFCEMQSPDIRGNWMMEL